MSSRSRRRALSGATLGTQLQIGLPIVISLLVAVVLSVYPLGVVLSQMRPMFLFVVTAFWVLHRPAVAGVWFAFGVGILADLLLDTQLGAQALCSVLSIALLQLLTRRSKQIADLEAWVYASISICCYSVCLLMVQMLTGKSPLWLSGVPMVTGVLIWPVVVLLLKRY